MRVLVIEPTRLYRAMLTSLLESMGLEVLAVETGEEGKALVVQRDFNLLCTAMHLSDMSGIDLAHSLRENQRTQQLPVVLLTSEDDKTQLSRALEAGVTEIYHKTDTAQLESYLRYFVNNESAGTQIIGRVLYVEDSELLAKLVIVYLNEMGLTVDHFDRAEDAVNAFMENEYDLVLTDFFLKGEMTGSGLLREVRSMAPDKARVPVLVVSGFSDDSRKLELLKSGANDYISKPILQEELQVRVYNMIKSKLLVDRLEQQQASLKKLAMTDQLTSLYNRHYLFDVAPKKISEARRHEQAFCVVVIDLDHFKVVNDTHGHATGDIVLKEAGNLLRESVRNEDMVARFGGEEFVALLNHCDLQGGAVKAEALRSALEALQPAGLRITGSFGVAQYNPEEHTEFSQLFDDADKAVYVAKESGRNCVKLAGPDTDGIEVNH